MLRTYDIDLELLSQAMQGGRHQSEDSALKAALTEYIRHLHRLEAAKLMETIDFHDDFDIKAMRAPRSEKRNAT